MGDLWKDIMELLHHCVRRAHLTIVKTGINKGDDINSESENGLSPLYHAVGEIPKALKEPVDRARRSSQIMLNDNAMRKVNCTFRATINNAV